MISEALLSFVMIKEALLIKSILYSLLKYDNVKKYFILTTI